MLGLNVLSINSTTGRSVVGSESVPCKETNRDEPRRARPGTFKELVLQFLTRRPVVRGVRLVTCMSAQSETRKHVLK